MRSRETVSHDVQISRLRIPGLLRMIASAENRALKLSAEQKDGQAAAVQRALRRYRLELDRLSALAEGRVPAGPSQPEDISSAVDDALRRLREERRAEEDQEAAPAPSMSGATGDRTRAPVADASASEAAAPDAATRPATGHVADPPPASREQPKPLRPAAQPAAMTPRARRSGGRPTPPLVEFEEQADA